MHPGPRRSRNGIPQALGFKGYWLPPVEVDPRDARDWSHVNQSLEPGFYAHENLLYADSVDHDIDLEVDILGGLMGVAYRSGFFDLRKLTDYVRRGAFRHVIPRRASRGSRVLCFACSLGACRGIKRQLPQAAWPGGAFFVDDDWISLVLDAAGGVEGSPGCPVFSWSRRLAGRPTADERRSLVQF